MAATRAKEGASGKKVSASGHDLTPMTKEEIEAEAKDLPAKVRSIALESGTEYAFSGKYYTEKREGIYVSVIGGLPLYSSAAKYDSGSGWPSFFEPIDKDHVVEKTDVSHGMVRTEVLCARSGIHLGHVFDDGPPPTGRRHCINSASLVFIPKGEPIPARSQPITPPSDGPAAAGGGSS